MNQAWEIVIDVAKDMPGGLPVFYAFLSIGGIAALTFLLETLLVIFKTAD